MDEARKIDIANGSFIDSWPEAIRWFIMPFAAVLGAAIVQALYGIFISNSAEQGSVQHGLFEFARTAIMMGAFVYIGAFVAPKHQTIVAVILLVVAAILLTVLTTLVLVYSSGNYTGSDTGYFIAAVIAGLAGSGIATFAVHQEVSDQSYKASLSNEKKTNASRPTSKSSADDELEDWDTINR